MTYRIFRFYCSWALALSYSLPRAWIQVYMCVNIQNNSREIAIEWVFRVILFSLVLTNTLKRLEYTRKQNFFEITTHSFSFSFSLRVFVWTIRFWYSKCSLCNRFSFVTTCCIQSNAKNIRRTLESRIFCCICFNKKLRNKWLKNNK